MIERFRAAGLVWPTLVALAALAALIALGSWQLSRKAWKDGLIAQIGAGLKAAPRDLGTIAIDPTSRAAVEAAAYRRIRATGTFDHEAERYVYAPDPRLGSGWNVFTPLRLGHATVMVNRGFVPEALKDRRQRAAGLPQGPVTVVGLLRPGGVKAMFVPANDVVRNVWFWPDLEAMSGLATVGPSSAGGRGKEASASVLPFYLDAEAEPPNPGGWPRGGTTNLDIPNRHLEYAVTWFGLAATLIAVYVAFALGRLRPET